MKIIDWQCKGNLIKFYLGKDDLETWYGDDWNDVPYEHNAGVVYDRFISDTTFLFVPWCYAIIEPSYFGSSFYCKDDFSGVGRARYPHIFMIILREKEHNYYDWSSLVKSHKGIRIKMGDKVEDIKKKIVIEEL